jgi:lysozyme
MRVSPESRLALEHHEYPKGRYSPFPYLDAKGIPTIGIGFTEGVTMLSPPMPYAEAAAKFDYMLRTEYEPKINELLGDAITSQKQYDALAILAWNIGLPGLKTSTVLRMHKAGKYQAAARAFAMWNKVTSDGVHKINDVLYPKGTLVVLDGLTNRRADEARLYLDGSSADGQGNWNDAIERSTQPSPDSDKPLHATRTMSGVTVTSLAASASVIAQLTSSVKDVAGNTVGVAREFGDPLLVFGIGGGFAALAGIAWVAYARWQDRQAGVR